VKGRVLVVDDDATILEVLEMRLTAMGFDVTATTDPARAVEATIEQRFDVALFDLRMDPVDGISLMEKVHARQARLPILIMTAHATIETAVEAVQRGAFDYLTKPFVRDELRAKINRALTTRRWARDRERLLAVGQTLASSGIMGRTLDAVAQAAVETTEAEVSVVFQLDRGRLTPMASAGVVPESWAVLEEAASQAIATGAPLTYAAADGRMVVAAPLVVQRGPAGALVIETPTNVQPGEDDLELLALFSSQAAVAIRNTHELQRLRTGALAALGRMAMQVAHELRNPLAGLRLYARHLEQRLQKADDGDGEALARKITATIDHLAGVVAEITAVGKTPTLNPAPTSLAALLDECINLARARVTEPTLEVVRRYDPECPEALVDVRQLRKAFLNFIINGLEALGPGGSLTVGIACATTSNTLEVTFEDTGCGMSEDLRARVFDFFFTTKPEGTGLGMAIARNVIESHGGSVALTSAAGEGTRVTITLPVGGPSLQESDAEARA
jgi:signal transduction histidine kinase